MAEKTKKKGEYNQEELYEMTDPIAYRSDYNPDDIINKDDPNIPWVWPQNANLNYNQYGDDSNPAQQGQLWWMKEKYTWEWVATSNLEYNPNVKTSDLDYKYWEAARQANAADAGYLARRNDNIASALYNEWKTTKEDVAYYLASQPDWNNSTEMDRANTIESIWKRIWELWPKEEQPTEATEEKTDTAQPVNEWNKIYWKTWPDTWEPTEWITMLEDANNIYNEQMQVRINNVKTLLSIPVSAIATELENGDIPWDMQSIIDYKEWYPDMWVQVEAERKKIRWQETVNAIASWEDIPSWTNGTSAANNEIANFAADNASYSKSMTDVMKDVHQTLEESKTAQWASAVMADIEEEVATLNKRLKNLKEEANNIFKWDVPDYIVKAYINNRTQEIQDKLSILSERYKYASARYDKEVANAENWVISKEASNAKLNEWMATNSVSEVSSSTSKSLSWKDLPMTNKSRVEIWNIVDNLVTMLNNKELGNAQCATWIQTYYLPSLWISFWTLSDWGNKLWIRNEWKSYTPQKWDLIIMLWSKAKYWHMWIVVWITENGKIQYLDWNGDKSWDEKPALREIEPDSVRIQWYYNATKEWTQTTTNSSKWTSVDYAQFKEFIEWNKSDRESIAASYGLTVEDMNTLIRNVMWEWTTDWTSNSSLSDAWYDSELWFIPSWNKIYEAYLNNEMNKSDIEWYEKTIWEWQLWIQAWKYSKAKDEWYVAYTYPNRIINPDLWYLEWKEKVYETILAKLASNKKIDSKEQELYKQQLWLDPKDINAWDTIIKEVDAYEKANNQKFEEIKWLIEAAEYIMMQDADWLQRVNSSWLQIWEWATWNKYYKFIISNEALNKLADSKWKWATLTPMSDKDFQAIKEASTLIERTAWAEDFRRNVWEYYNTLREIAWLKQLTEDELDDMWNTESDAKSKWDNYLIIDHASDINWRYRYYNWKKAYKWTKEYDLAWPKKANSVSTNNKTETKDIENIEEIGSREMDNEQTMSELFPS